MHPRSVTDEKKSVSLFEAGDVLRRGGIAVIPTDTLYGVVAVARHRGAVARLYRLRRGETRKPFIILIHSTSELAWFGITLTQAQRRILRFLWPGKVSVVFACSSRRFSYLHRGAKTLAFRLPKSSALRALLKKTGPLVAPSANLPGKPPVATIAQARECFGTRIDFYSAGELQSRKPSTLVLLRADGALKILRKGAARIFLGKGGILQRVR